MFLDQFYVFFSSDLHAFCGIEKVHVYDGSALIWPRRLGEKLSGDWSQPREVVSPEGAHFSNTWVPRDASGLRLQFNTAFGLSLNVGSILEGEITFHSACCNWVDTAG